MLAIGTPSGVWSYPELGCIKLSRNDRFSAQKRSFLDRKILNCTKVHRGRCGQDLKRQNRQQPLPILPKNRCKTGTNRRKNGAISRCAEQPFAACGAHTAREPSPRSRARRIQRESAPCVRISPRHHRAADARGLPVRLGTPRHHRASGARRPGIRRAPSPYANCELYRSAYAPPAASSSSCVPCSMIVP